MTLGDALGSSDGQERYIVRGMQFALVGLIGYAVATAQFGIAETAGLALAITLVPALLRRSTDTRWTPASSSGSPSP